MFARNKISRAPFFSIRRNMVLTAIFYTFLWGSAFPLVKICMESFAIAAYDNMSKCLVAGIRFFISGALTLAFCKIFGRNGIRISKKGLAYSSGYGVIATALQYAFTYIGLSMIDGAKGAVYDQLGVFIIVLTSGLIFKNEKLGINKIIGCILGFVGILAINADGLSFSFSLGGEGIMLLAVICQTGSYFIAKKSTDALDAPLLTGYGQLIGGALLCVFALIFGGHIDTVNPTAVISLILLSLISAIAYALSLMPLRYFPASEVSSFNLLITVFGVVMSAALLGENIFRINYAVSLALIGSGIFFINRR